MKKVVILISGRGSNMQAIVDAQIANTTIAAIVSNNEDALGIAWAKNQGLATVIMKHKQYSTRFDYDQALIKKIEEFQPDLVVLAGFMRILTAEFCNRFKNRLINIHPSLLPAFTGLDTHKKAIESGSRVSGCTIHFVRYN